ncbi:CLUMA_CG001257, isoform A [Clunio marinus]|uniref:CLUMA_CG001257, isoform A n=1 Tax=Clunio marinus TaxID=568069 RepID=A0A1J1HHF0_9DIPT|nr:CLUMA_CG001257, isoform A [Clunio marinus]
MINIEEADTFYKSLLELQINASQYYDQNKKPCGKFCSSEFRLYKNHDTHENFEIGKSKKHTTKVGQLRKEKNMKWKIKTEKACKHVIYGAVTGSSRNTNHNTGGCEGEKFCMGEDLKNHSRQRPSRGYVGLKTMCFNFFYDLRRAMRVFPDDYNKQNCLLLNFIH